MSVSIPLLCLLGYGFWVFALVSTIAGVRVLAVLSGRVAANAFPSGERHGSDRYWRLNRAHANALETLPLFATVVLVAAVGGYEGPSLDEAAIGALVARVVQTVVHVSGASSTVVHVRFTFFTIQLGCIAWMGLQVTRALL